MEKIAAPIDNKNLMEDPFEDDVFGNFYPAYDHRVGKMRHLIGHKEVKDEFNYEEGLVDVKWQWGDNCIRITLLAVPGVSDSYDWEYARKVIFGDYRKLFKSWECEENENLVVEFYELVNTLNVIFYFECEYTPQFLLENMEAELK